MLLRGGNEVVGTTLKSYEAVMDSLAAVQKQNMLFGMGWIEGSFRMLQMQAEFNLRMAETVAGRADGVEQSPPIDGYDRLSVEEISPRLEQLDARGIEELKVYEKRHKNRGMLVEKLDRALV